MLFFHFLYAFCSSSSLDINRKKYIMKAAYICIQKRKWNTNIWREEKARRENKWESWHIYRENIYSHLSWYISLYQWESSGRLCLSWSGEEKASSSSQKSSKLLSHLLSHAARKYHHNRKVMALSIYTPKTQWLAAENNVHCYTGMACISDNGLSWRLLSSLSSCNRLYINCLPLIESVHLIYTPVHIEKGPHLSSSYVSYIKQASVHYSLSGLFPVSRKRSSI